jgi:hypothetical protein
LYEEDFEGEELGQEGNRLVERRRQKLDMRETARKRHRRNLAVIGRPHSNRFRRSTQAAAWHVAAFMRGASQTHRDLDVAASP